MNHFCIMSFNLRSFNKNKKKSLLFKKNYYYILLRCCGLKIKESVGNNHKWKKKKSQVIAELDVIQSFTNLSQMQLYRQYVFPFAFIKTYSIHFVLYIKTSSRKHEYKPRRRKPIKLFFPYMKSNKQLYNLANFI